VTGVFGNAQTISAALPILQQKIPQALEAAPQQRVVIRQT